jgi:TRAP-type C4-dicarboxylate transport system substrate-binding protein
MGATTVTMPFGEVFAALQQGVIDAQENTIDQIVSAKMYEVQKFVILTNHQFQASMVVFSAGKYNKMTPEEKCWVDKAGADCAAFESGLTKKATVEAEEFLNKNGTPIVTVDTASFATAASKAYAGYTPLMQEWIKTVQDVK